MLMRLSGPVARGAVRRVALGALSSTQEMGKVPERGAQVLFHDEPRNTKCIECAASRLSLSFSFTTSRASKGSCVDERARALTSGGKRAVGRSPAAYQNAVGVSPTSR